MKTFRQLQEKAASKQQQKLMGLALAYKRGEVPEDEVSSSVKDMASSMSEKELEDFASTKHKGLPDKVDEGKSSTGYELYHRDFSSAMQHAYKHAKAKLGVDVDPEEIDSKVASGPRKPSKGKTNSYRLLDKGGKKAIQVQVYGMDNGKYELNMYKESVDEAVSIDGRSKTFKETMKRLNVRKQKLAEKEGKKPYLEIGTNEIVNKYAAMTPGQTSEAATSPYDTAATVLAVGAAKKGVDAVKKGASAIKKGVGNVAKKITKIGSTKPVSSKPTPVRPKPTKSTLAQSGLRKKREIK